MLNLIEELVFREIAEDDIAIIVNIHNSNVVSNYFDYEKKGFLLQKITCKNVKCDINNSKNKYYVATDTKNSVFGYIAISKKINKDILSHVLWKKTFNDQLTISKECIYICDVATKPSYAGKGIGKYLYRQLYSHYPKHTFIAFVATKPHNNQRSLDFHLKQGFNIVGQYQNNFFCGFKNYESKLVLKN